MKNLPIAILFLSACSHTSNQRPTAESFEEEKNLQTMRIDFGQEAENPDWFALNDDVMGGVSVGVVALTESSVIFEGEVSTDNNGGFVSLRSPMNAYDLSPYTDVVIAYRGEGQDFTMVLADNPAWYMPKFESKVIEESSEWTTSTVSLYDFTQYAMTNYGEVETGEEMSPGLLSDVIRIELMNSAFESGEFWLEIDYIEFQGPEAE
jgi:NADH dehydrogenase [ubiquinone] 1 alpha subcomplex assembly factor 1